ncbi:hypothetical protein K491DRAFT_502855 [Lophiostoma macrostomum CBS 122681]|uniref:Zn(2)-C6 fungal-type domain-containing protein n=1 Tax=Lophiostoma macrostomum CBS 122681 TaxID=1314788 RepID=A0A6A6T334_9PLEO|nr:hypothetical protein K491DRAFT_502855 [Lophiostoma macrostomum CBS 122681]
MRLLAIGTAPAEPYQPSHIKDATRAGIREWRRPRWSCLYRFDGGFVEERRRGPSLGGLVATSRHVPASALDLDPPPPAFRIWIATRFADSTVTCNSMRSVTKSRNGCARCKRQKVRCDQTKPDCGRCARVGVQCPGYSQPLKWSTKYEKLNTQTDQTVLEPDNGPVSAHSPRLASPALDDIFSLDIPDMMLSGFMLDYPYSTSCIPTSRDVVTLPDFDSPHAGPTNPNAHHNDDFYEPQTPGSVAVSSSLTSPPLRRSLSDVSTVLTEFYFKEAASLYSVYDSAMNPFRSTVAQLWSSSRLLHCTLQSMSAACLLENFPHLAGTGKELRNEAITILKSQQEHDHTSLLALLMLGGSSSWHTSEQTGSQYFNLARKRLASMVNANQLQKDSNNYHFFEEALIYWELLLAYVDDNVVPAPTTEDHAENSIYLPSRHIPHPWTGVARDTQITVQEVGRLIRRSRVLARSGGFATAAHIEELQHGLSIARKLESRLTSLTYPDEQDIVSPGDRLTPVWHLLTLAEVYRRTGLAQLYRAFPDLLDDRLASDLETGVFAEVTFASRKNKSFQRNDWLTTYALETLEMLETIPIESGTRDFQPFLLVALCSELRLPVPKASQSHFLPLIHDEAHTTVFVSENLEDNSPRANLGPTPETVPDFTMRSIKIVRTRQFILDRLTSFVRILPPKPMQVCLNIVKESWSRIDDAQQPKSIPNTHPREVYWMDVMMDNKWETCMA